MNEKDQQQIIEYYTIINALYSQYGNELSDPKIISQILEHEPELGKLIKFTIQTIGFHHVESLIKTYRAHTPEQITSTINPNNQLGISIQSTHGNAYKRTLSQDINKLIHG